MLEIKFNPFSWKYTEYLQRIESTAITQRNTSLNMMSSYTILEKKLRCFILSFSIFLPPAKIQNRGHYYIPFLCASTQETLTGAGFSSHIQRPKLLV